MKKALVILKITSLTLLLIGVGIGYLFFHAWQTNERPTTLKVNWEKESVALGHTNSLEITMRVPWHREINSASPSSSPDFLPVVPKSATLTRKRLRLDGHRDWVASIPLVPTAVKPVEGLTLSLPLTSTKRPSPSSVNVALPALTIFSPGNLPKLVENARHFIQEDEPALAKENQTAQSEGFPWILVTIAALLLGSMIFFYFRNPNNHDQTSAWQSALGKLTALEKEPDLAPDVFFSRLTDILKRYTSHRFEIPAETKTTAEFLLSVYELNNVPQIETMELPWLGHLADNIKFAGSSPNTKEPAEALTLVRNFVTKTKPAPEPHDHA